MVDARSVIMGLNVCLVVHWARRKNWFWMSFAALVVLLNIIDIIMESMGR